MNAGCEGEQFDSPFKKVTPYQCTMKLSVRGERTWISHSDVNLKMRKKRVMVPLSSHGLLHRSEGKTNRSLYQTKWRDLFVLSGGDERFKFPKYFY